MSSDDLRQAENGLNMPSPFRAESPVKNWSPAEWEFYEKNIHEEGLTPAMLEGLKGMVRYLWETCRKHWDPELCGYATTFNLLALQRYIKEHAGAEGFPFLNPRMIRAQNGAFVHYWTEVDAAGEEELIPIVLDGSGHTAFIGAYIPYFGVRPKEDQNPFYSRGKETDTVVAFHP